MTLRIFLVCELGIHLCHAMRDELKGIPGLRFNSRVSSFGYTDHEGVACWYVDVHGSRRALDEAMRLVTAMEAARAAVVSDLKAHLVERGDFVRFSEHEYVED